MKAVVAIGVMQLVITGLLLFKVVSLETNLDDLKSKLNSATQQRLSTHGETTPLRSSQQVIESALSIDDIRFAVRAELESDLTRDNSLSPPLAEVEQRNSDPELISEFESRIDYYLSDGAFSRLDLLDMENKLVKLEPADRRRMMNKLTQAMNRANIQFFE